MSKRQFIILSGNECWGIEQTILLLSPIINTDQQILWSATPMPDSLKNNLKQVSIHSKTVDIEQHLGTEYAGLVVNAYQGFNANLFCALAATIRTPGLIILITPQFDTWPKYNDNDYKRFLSYPYTDKAVKGRYISYLINAFTAHRHNNAINFLYQADPTSVAHTKILQKEIEHNFREIVVSQDQQTLAQQRINKKIFQLIDENKKKLLIICAARGRGKSASIGKALQKKLKHTHLSAALSISIVSQSRRNINTLIDFLSSGLQVDNMTANYFTFGKHKLRYMPPDICINQSPKTDLMIIDEAASIPIYQLEKLIQISNKNILSTTTDGYEGTGQGFRHKFIQQLMKTNIDYEELGLEKPLRWPEQDAIESWIQKNLLLTTSPVSLSDFQYKYNTFKQLVCEKLDRDLLIYQIDVLKNIYALLASAHYRTTPDDLRLLLDSPTASIWIIKFKAKVIAAAVCMDEGGLPSKLAQQVCLGKRRVQGHLVTQSLLNHMGLIEAAPLLYRRITRIAVTPSLQKKGLGKKLVEFVCKQSLISDKRIDSIAVSFSANKETLDFWLKCGFKAARLGTHKNARSGNISILMMKALSKPAESLSNSAGMLLKENLSLNARFNHNNKPTLLFIHNNEPLYMDLSRQYKSDIYYFAFGCRQFETCHPALYYYASIWLKIPQLMAVLKDNEIELLEKKVLKNIDWKNIEHLCGIQGKKSNLANIRMIYARLYSAAWGNKS